MLKRLIILFFVFAYLVPAIGFSVDVHWCGKSVRVVDLNSVHQARSPCKTNMPKGCCKDKHILMKLTDAHKNFTSVNNLKSFTSVKVQGPIFINSLISDFPIFVFDFSKYHAPPFKSKEPPYLTNSTFRI